MQVKVPGKLIISGEHAVVYGKPALVMAVNRYCLATLRRHGKETISFCLNPEGPGAGNTTNVAFELKDFALLVKKLESKYREFCDDKIKISEVMDDPTLLMPFAFGLVADRQHVNLTTGLEVVLNTDIPVGCGMGSSAAIALSILQATVSYFKIDIGDEQLYEYALLCEQLQHGRPSGVDPYICIHGGFVEFQQGRKTELKTPKMHFFLALTGRPESSTGECVMHVRDNFRDSQILDEVGGETVRIREGLLQGDQTLVRSGVRRNHRLLTDMGIVPQRVQAFVREVEKRQGAAKISGGGSVRGDNAGVVLVFVDEKPDDLCARFNYPLLEVEVDNNGLQIC